MPLAPGLAWCVAAVSAVGLGPFAFLCFLEKPPLIRLSVWRAQIYGLQPENLIPAHEEKISAGTGRDSHSADDNEATPRAGADNRLRAGS
jgi:hypothetical protein